MVNTSDIDFVHNEADRDELMQAIRRRAKGVQHYVPDGPGA